jgi:hypothetical protein
MLNDENNRPAVAGEALGKHSPNEQEWRKLPDGHWFYLYSAGCTFPHSVMKRTDSGCTAVCNSPWDNESAIADMKSIAGFHNAAQPTEGRAPTEFHKPGQIPVNAPTCDKCGKIFLDCQCGRDEGQAALRDLLNNLSCSCMPIHDFCPRCQLAIDEARAAAATPAPQAGEK